VEEKGVMTVRGSSKEHMRRRQESYGGRKHEIPRIESGRGQGEKDWTKPNGEVDIVPLQRQLRSIPAFGKGETVLIKAKKKKKIRPFRYFKRLVKEQ